MMKRRGEGAAWSSLNCHSPKQSLLSKLCSWWPILKEINNNRHLWLKSLTFLCPFPPISMACLLWMIIRKLFLSINVFHNRNKNIFGLVVGISHLLASLRPLYWGRKCNVQGLWKSPMFKSKQTNNNDYDISCVMYIVFNDTLCWQNIHTFCNPGNMPFCV